MDLSSKKVVVTGGCGFIGSHIVERAAGVGAEVIIIDNLISGREENLNGIDGNITFHRASVTEDIEKYMTGADLIFHLAANVFVAKSVEDPHYDAENNIKGILNVLECARKLDIPKMVYSSSSAIYGDDVAVPTDENQPISPSSPYGVSKYVGELYCRTYTDLYGIDTVALRYFNVFGPRQTGDNPYSGVIAIFIQNALDKKPLTIYGDGEQSRDFVGVRDVVEANISSAVKPNLKGEAFNIGTGSSITINKLADIIESMAGKLEREYAPARKGDIKCSTADISRAQKVLGFSPTVSLEGGLEELFKLYQGKS
ncbi:MAG: NAD-dependent epimerase/dehydratase family protein [Thermoplasmata archaeon]|nr:MAG: NAD-dependent epimerase/dehydratase family protein [Thermoplasmata archaeon]